MSRLLLVVAGVLYDREGRILLAKRPVGKAMAGLWEFPGGKLEPGETPEAALARELAEELRIEADANTMKPLSFASHAYQDFHLLMPLYEVNDWMGVPDPAEGQSLDWVAPAHLDRYPAPPADIPLFAFLAGKPE